MGVQRSGTNTLFRSLVAAPGVTGFNEDDPLVFEDGALRPEPTLRPLLHDSAPVVIKPISETKWRSVASVLDEFAAYELRVPWIYRDPVDCYASHIARWKGFRGKPEAFAIQWRDRNQSVLDALETHGESIAIVRYADLCGDPRVFRSLAAFVGVDGRNRFGRVRTHGDDTISDAHIQVIRSLTNPVWSVLEVNRRFVGEPMAWMRRHWLRMFPASCEGNLGQTF